MTNIIVNLIFGVSFFFYASCQESKVESKLQNDISNNMQDLVGVLVWEPKPKQPETVSMLNVDLSKAGSFNSYKSFEFLSLYPYSYSEDYEILVFKIKEIDSLYYHVYVSKDERKVELISKEIKSFKFETWQNHILSVFSVEFDPKLNPLHKSPNSTSLNSFDNEQFYHPLSIEGDWLEVEDDDGVRSFIKWRENEKIIVDLFYTS